MKHMKLALTVLAATTLLTSAALGQPGQRFGKQRGMMGMGKRGGMPFLLMAKEQLNLSEQQISKIEEMHFAFQKERTLIQNELNLLRIEGRKVMMEGTETDLAQVKKHLERRSALSNKMILLGMKHRRDALKVLTKEQQEKLKTLRNTMGRNGFRRGGNRGFMGRGDDRKRRFPMNRRPMRGGRYNPLPEETEM